MPDFILYNSQTRRKEPFKPLKAGKIGLYVCGMTVYDYCHIGHARVMVSFDVLVRFLRAQGWQVTYVRNITDIDDKIILRAQEQQISMTELTGRFIDAMNEDATALGCLSPDQAPRATDFIPQMQQMIGQLINKEHAYAVANGDVYYAVESFADYGKLSGRKLTDMQAGASQRVETDMYKKNPFDFVLWKAAKPLEPSWPSPWGEGRPGWHIECSAMSTCCLGNHFDIHGGGGDLLFPHHENEIAQSEGATGEPYVNTWLHVGFVNVDGEKMSKSLGNFFTIRDVMQKFAPEVIRYFIIASHYRSGLNFSDSALKDARQALSRLYIALKSVADLAQKSPLDTAVLTAEHAALLNDIKMRFMAALADDLNTPIALAALFDSVRHINRAMNDGQTDRAHALATQLVELGGILGILQQPPQAFLQQAADSRAVQTDNDGLAAIQIEAAIEARRQAKADKDYAGADKIRQDLLMRGIILEDSHDGTTWRRAD